MKRIGIALALLSIVLAGCGTATQQNRTFLSHKTHATAKLKTSCITPVTAYFFGEGVGGLSGESPAWWNVSRPIAGRGRAVEAVVAGSPLWTVEDLYLTPTDTKRVMAQWKPGTFSLTPVVARVCFRSRDSVSVLSARLASGAAATRALELAEGIEIAVPTSAKPGGTLTVVFSQGSLYDVTYRSILPSENVVLYAYTHPNNLLYQLTLLHFSSANDQDVFVFALPQDMASGTYSLVFQHPGLPRSPGTKPGEPGFLFANGVMDGGFTFQVQ